MIALIDADIVVYRCAAANEHSEEGIARWQVDEMMQRIIDETQATSYRSFLTGGGNFRFNIYPEYKANRKDMAKPKWHGILREHLATHWNAEVSDGHEADDAMGVAQCMGATDSTIICSIDKDMLMIPGMHYNFVKKEFREVDEISGIRHLYWQAIMGDKVDNIPGFDGLMRSKVPKKMEWMIDTLNDLQEEWQMYHFLQSVHNANVPLDVCLQCLWIWRKEGDIWQNKFGQTQGYEPSLSQD